MMMLYAAITKNIKGELVKGHIDYDSYEITVYFYISRSLWIFGLTLKWLYCPEIVCTFVIISTQ